MNNRKYKNSLPPEYIKEMQTWTHDQKLEYIRKFCQLISVSCDKVLKLIPQVSFFKPTVYNVPICDCIKGEGSYLLYHAVVAGHNVQLTWGIHEISAGDCTVPQIRHGLLALNEYAVAALMVRFFPSIKDELSGKNVDVTSVPQGGEGWEYFTKDKDIIL